MKIYNITLIFLIISVLLLPYFNLDPPFLILSILFLLLLPYFHLIIIHLLHSVIDFSYDFIIFINNSLIGI
jgi:hypothetical protein